MAGMWVPQLKHEGRPGVVQSEIISSVDNF